MNKKRRKEIANKIRFELNENNVTFHLCPKCKVKSCGREMCWNCWLKILEEGKE